MLILGIETSCDETAASVVANGKKILSNVVASQTQFHDKYGGVVPEIASRKHLELINPVINEVLERANIDFSDLSAIAVTIGPGLVGALLVGMAAAKALSYALSLPLVGINHLEAHIYANFLEHPRIKPPLVALVVSGGHTTLAYMREDWTFEVLGETLDDAAGEAFDKIARFLGLGYPGGPVIDELSRKGNPEAIPFPRAMIGSPSYDFSLSGLKTSVLNYVSNLQRERRKIPVADLVASFQAAIVDVQVAKLLRAARERKVGKILLAGGVAANTALRRKLAGEARKLRFRLYSPSPYLCTDNAAMIACVGYYHLRAGKTIGLGANVDANLKLGQLAGSS
jgi:N6-L-threonylcarbamoyladenine synthase